MNQQKKEKKWAHEVSLAVDSGLVYVECRTKLILVLDYRSLTRLLNTVGDKARRKSRKERPLYNMMNKWKVNIADCGPMTATGTDVVSDPRTL